MSISLDMVDDHTDVTPGVHCLLPVQRPTTHLSQRIRSSRPQLSTASHKQSMTSPTGGVHETCSLGCTELLRGEAYWCVLGYRVDAWDAQCTLVVPPEQPRSAVHVNCHYLTPCARRIYCGDFDVTKRAQYMRFEEVRATVGSELSTPSANGSN